MSGRAVLIRGARSVDGPLEPTSYLLVDGRIAATGTEADGSAGAGARRVDADGLIAAPGLIELQVNGGFGHDFSADPTSIWAVGARLADGGVTAFLPTIVSSPSDVVAVALAVVAAGPPAGYDGAAVLGLHLEGPFLSPLRSGAHNPAHLRTPDRTLAAGWTRGNGVRLATIAPELPGALGLIADLAARGVVVSAGHSAASHAEAIAGIEAGIRYATHLFNAMPPIDEREPGLIDALLADDRVTVGLIPDGLHVQPERVELAWRAAGPTRLSLVSDAMAALGMPPGRYPLGDRDVEVGERGARTEDGRLAGSVMVLADGIRNLVAFTGCRPSEAIAATTAVPARLLGLSDRGRLVEGANADIVLLTAELAVESTFVRGRDERGWA